MNRSLLAALTCALGVTTVAAVADEPARTGATADRSAGETIADATLTARIETMYLLNENLNPFRINTTTRNGEVTLTGTVDDTIERDLAETLAMNLEGVTRVDNQLEVAPNERPMANDERRAVRARLNDANLTADVRRRLAYNRNLADANIGVEVRDQAVRIYGTVPSEAVQREAERTVQDTRGVLEVRNDLVVDATEAQPQVADSGVDRRDASEDQGVVQEIRGALSDAGDAISDEWIEKRVETQLALNRNVSLLDLDVEVRDGVALISGSVVSENQKDVVDDIARNTSGVQDVQNDIRVREVRTE